MEDRAPTAAACDVIDAEVLSAAATSIYAHRVVATARFDDVTRVTKPNFWSYVTKQTLY